MNYYSFSYSFGVFCLPGDPNVAAHLKSVINSSQLVHYNDKDRIVYTKTALERQHKIVALSIYSTISESVSVVSC